MKLWKSRLIKGTLILTIAGIITRIIGFVYRIYLADILGSKLLGIYQLVFPVYGICFTIYGAGIQTAISQLIASSSGDSSSSRYKKHSPYKILLSGCILSLAIAIFLSLIVYVLSDQIAVKLLLEKDCAKYIRILASLFPFCSISACICGYYYGIQNAKVPAIAQIVEQTARVAFVAAVCFAISLTQKVSPEINCIIATAGLTVGELAGCLFNVIAFSRLRHKQKKENTSKSYSQSSVIGALISLSFTLTSTKLILSILHSVESIFIPAALRKYGLSSADALSIYGILSGMAIPFILFPSAITSSFAIMLLPSVAKSQAEEDYPKIRTSVTLTAKYSLIIGWLFTCIFLIYGKRMGIIFFDNETAGTYITILAWLCPFLYVSTTFSSIINGLGHTQFTFIITVISLSVKIYFLIALVPVYGITAYLVGTLISQIILTFMAAFFLKKYIAIDSVRWILLPCTYLCIIGIVSRRLYMAIYTGFPGISEMIVLGIITALITVAYVLLLLVSRCVDMKEL